MLKVIPTDQDGHGDNALVFKGTRLPAEITGPLTYGDFHVQVELNSLFQEFDDCRFSDIAENISILIINVPRDEILNTTFLQMDIEGGTQNSMHIQVRSMASLGLGDKPALGLTSMLILDVPHWNAPFSPTDYIQKLQGEIVKISKLTVKVDRNYDYYVRFIHYPKLTQSINEEVRRFILSINTAIQETETQLGGLKDSIVTTFQFPESVSISCEQYLLYFVQFLRDVGIEADSQITREAGQVLFSVTPLDKNQALDKIRVALDAYLRLPSSPISNTELSSIAVQRCESQIFRLLSDLRLAAPELQARNATIEAQQLSITIYKGMLSGEVVLDSVVKPDSAQDREEVLDGLAAITIFKKEGIPIEVNLPRLFRKLKNWFAEK